MKDLWIPAGAASKILSERFGRPVRVDYVTKLGKLKRLRTQHIGSRMVLYNRHDVETIIINPRKPKEEVTKPIEDAVLLWHSAPRLSNLNALCPQANSLIVT